MIGWTTAYNMRLPQNAQKAKQYINDEKTTSIEVNVSQRQWTTSVLVDRKEVMHKIDTRLMLYLSSK